MLPRQLHRPLLRSVTAAWRPATTSAVSFRYGESRSSSSSSSGSDLQQEDEDDASSRVPNPQGLSLLEQLHPVETKRLHQAKANAGSDTDVPQKQKSWASHLFVDDDPPRLAFPEEPQDEQEADSAQSDAPDFYSQALRAKSMLILSAASKSLLESDFLRLGMKGKHVEGWVGGILKVIQARDPDTLEPKGHYFILFDTDESAAAYKDRLEYLWQLGKTHVPGAHHARRHMAQQRLPRGLRHTRDGEDVARLIASFTLVPPSQKLHVQQSRVSASRVAALYAEGGFVARLAARAGSRFLVMVRLDGGRLTLGALRRAIEEDGAHRRLAWRITDLDGGGGILPFGKSILKAKDRVHQEVVDGASGSATERGGGGGDSYGGTTTGQEAEEGNERNRQYPRFIIPFADKAEAYRFVQNWHRRELRLHMGGSGEWDDPSWEEHRIVNATVLW
ncbi:hypothetical protein F5Y12DRAFT_269476 [Xylaria sp. FL1777]|nr:hypothetical protein F5Y12DRAFT_269476 [Xylaria sp. FL1777]